MTELSWSRVRNKPSQCAEFAVCHDNYAWRKHHASKFGRLKNQRQLCASDSLSRAFTSDEDSILRLFSEVGNRTMRAHPEYGRPHFAIVWYDDEKWAILCTPNEAVLIQSSQIAGYGRKSEGVQARLRVIRRIWDASDQSLRIPLNQVITLLQNTEVAE